MNYKINWDITAIESFVEESDYIYKKWNQKEVEKFELLVEENIERLSKNPTIGKFDSKLDLYSLTISKHTTLYYNFKATNKIIELYLFWNNKINPDELFKLL